MPTEALESTKTAVNVLGRIRSGEHSRAFSGRDNLGDTGGNIGMSGMQ